MFSSKTTTMGALLNRYKIAGKNCCIVKLENDDRYSSNTVVTHDQRVLPFDTILSKSHTLADVLDKVEAYSVIAVEEGQFFTDIAETASQLRDAGKTLIVSALHATFERRPFDTTSKLLATSDKIIHLTAVCACGADAPYTQHIGPRLNVRDVQVQSQCLIGGSETYRAVCSRCYNS